MRTTIELTDEQRAELLKLAAKKGLKGFSPLVQEALDEYLKRQGGREDAVAMALKLKGSLRGKAAEDFEDRVKSLRELWRCS